jgi:membrane protein required for colicin V production
VNWLDFVIVAVIVWSAFAGLMTGLVREVVGLIAVVAGVFLAGKFYQRLADDIKIVHEGTLVNQLAAFLGIFAATVLAGQIATGVLKGAVSLLMLGPLDRLGGLALGIVTGCMVVELLLIAFAALPAAGWMSSALDHSLLAPIFLSGVPWLLKLLPAPFRAAAQSY